MSSSQRIEQKLDRAAHPANRPGFGLLLLAALLAVPVAVVAATFAGGSVVAWWIGAALVFVILGILRMASVAKRGA